MRVKLSKRCRCSATPGAGCVPCREGLFAASSDGTALRVVVRA